MFMERTVPNCSIDEVVCHALNKREMHQRKKKCKQEVSRLALEITKIFNLDFYDLEYGGRKREVVIPRQIFCYIARNKMNAEDRITGECINRDRTTVITSCQAVQNLLDTEDEMFLEYWNKFNNNARSEFVLNRLS